MFQFMIFYSIYESNVFKNFNNKKNFRERHVVLLVYNRVECCRNKYDKIKVLSLKKCCNFINVMNNKLKKKENLCLFWFPIQLFQKKKINLAL